MPWLFQNGNNGSVSNKMWNHAAQSLHKMQVSGAEDSWDTPEAWPGSVQFGATSAEITTK